jgi:hypothetical protein
MPEYYIVLNLPSLKKVKLPFYPKLPDIRTNSALKVPGLRPFVRLTRAVLK